MSVLLVGLNQDTHTPARSKCMMRLDCFRVSRVEIMVWANEVMERLV